MTPLEQLPKYELLRPYQVEDIKKFLQQDCGACFNEQRTGKTPIAILTMFARQLDKVIIVCPASMIYPWKDSYNFWTGKEATVCVGTQSKRNKIIEGWEHGPLIISYGCLKETKRSEGMVTQLIKKKPDACIADEAHHFKCHTTATAKAMYKLGDNIRFRLALTGTPATNKPVDIYGILRWLFPDEYKSYWNFVHHNFTTYKQYTGFQKYHMEIGDWLPTRKAIMATHLERFSTQRKRIEVMPWLPPKDYLKVRLPATTQQTKYLNELKEYFETEGLITQTVLDRMLKERQICISPQLVGLKGSSPKIDWLLEYVTDYPDKQIIIFTKFVKAIDLIHQALSEKRIKGQVIMGETPPATRAEFVRMFQTKEYRYLVLQIDACKEGLTLDEADVEIFMDVYPPAADVQQAEDRFVATTEDKKDKSHQIIQLMLEGTYDEECYNLVERRASSIECINSYIKYIKR